MSFLYHPAFQSLVLPFVLALAISALMRPLGLRWAALGAAIGLVLTMAAWPGFDWPPASRAQTLPWVAAAGPFMNFLMAVGWAARMDSTARCCQAPSRPRMPRGVANRPGCRRASQGRTCRVLVLDRGGFMGGSWRRATC